MRIRRDAVSSGSGRASISARSMIVFAGRRLPRKHADDARDADCARAPRIRARADAPATMFAVRTSSKPSSGLACRSRRMATTSSMRPGGSCVSSVMACQLRPRREVAFRRSRSAHACVPSASISAAHTCSRRPSMRAERFSIVARSMSSITLPPPSSPRSSSTAVDEVIAAREGRRDQRPSALDRRATSISTPGP